MLILAASPCQWHALASALIWIVSVTQYVNTTTDEPHLVQSRLSFEVKCSKIAPVLSIFRLQTVKEKAMCFTSTALDAV